MDLLNNRIAYNFLFVSMFFQKGSCIMGYQPGQPSQWPPQQPQYGPSSPNYVPPQQSQWSPQQSQQSQYGSPSPNFLPPQQPQWPPQQSFQQAPQNPPPKKKGFFSKKIGPIPMWVLILVLVVVFIGVASNSSKANNPNSTNTTQSSSSTASPSTNGAAQPTIAPTKAPAQAPTPKPTPAPKWTTVQTFTGNGIKKTAIFPVGNDWKVIWSCTPSSFYGGQYNVQVAVYNSDGTLADLAVNTICKSGNIADSTEEHQSGNIYLDINSEGAWKIQIQELK